MLSRLKGKFPNLRQLAPVYGVVVLFIYSWTILWFFWKLNGWLVYLNLGEVGVILAYSLALNLIESILVLSFPLILCLVLPARWFYDQFVARSTALLLPGLGFLIFAAYQFEGRTRFHQSLILKTMIPTVCLMFLLVLACGRWSWLRNLFENVAERASVFLYITLPLSTLSLLIVAYRNLF